LLGRESQASSSWQVPKWGVVVSHFFFNFLVFFFTSARMCPFYFFFSFFFWGGGGLGSGNLLDGVGGGSPLSVATSVVK